MAQNTFLHGIENMTRDDNGNVNERKHLLQFEGVDMYSDFKLPEVISAGYDFYIFDLGRFGELEPASFTTKDVKLIVANIKSIVGNVHILRFSGEIMYSFADREANKEFALQAAADYFQISLSDVVAFGDDHNDIEMLRECGVSVAMSNAIDECKEVAHAPRGVDCVCGDCDDDGVAQWLEANN